MKGKKIKELERECVAYACFMGELGFTKKELRKLERKYKIKCV